MATDHFQGTEKFSYDDCPISSRPRTGVQITDCGAIIINGNSMSHNGGGSELLVCGKNNSIGLKTVAVLTAA